MNQKTVATLGAILAEAFNQLDGLPSADLMKRYASITDAVDALVDEASSIADILKERHATEGDMEMHGVKVYGTTSKKIDHEGAAFSLVESDPGGVRDPHKVYETVAKFTTTKETTAWAKVTKDLKLDLKPFTAETPVVKVKYPA